MIPHNKFFYLIVVIPEFLFMSTYLSHNNMSIFNIFSILLYVFLILINYFEYINIKH